MALQSFVNPLYFCAAIVLAIISIILYKIIYDPLAHIPSPLIARLTPIWLYSLSFRGIEASTIDQLHKKFGAVVRVAPNEVDISDGAAIHQVYVKEGGFMKNPCYRNFDINGFPTIFSAQDPAYRAIRAKAVVSIFSQTAVQGGKISVLRCVDSMVGRLKREKDDAAGKPVDVLNIFRSFAMDMLTTYLFKKSYQGIEEPILSATGFVDSFVAANRFFYLPKAIFEFAERVTASFDKKRLHTLKSKALVEKFAGDVVDRAVTQEKGKGETYQERLLNAGISREETVANCLDAMFAGTDGVAMNLSAICCYLARASEKYERVREEVLDNPSVDAQSLPYLSSVIKEGLRLSMANPTRLARIVSSSGLQVQDLPSIPPGTSVGLSAYSLHHNPEVFPQPDEFLPERWLEPTPQMLRDSIPFGVGSRQCIARNLAAAGLWWAVEALVRSDVLRQAKPVKDRVEIFEWFNARAKDGRVELVW